jgi:hypothetical protein
MSNSHSPKTEPFGMILGHQFISKPQCLFACKTNQTTGIWSNKTRGTNCGSKRFGISLKKLQPTSIPGYEDMMHTDRDIGTVALQ